MKYISAHFKIIRFYYNILLFDLFSLCLVKIFFFYLIFMYLNYSLAFLGNTLNFLWCSKQHPI